MKNSTEEKIVLIKKVNEHSFQSFDPDENLIEMNYECGGEEDAEHFASKVERLAKDYEKDFSISLCFQDNMDIDEYDEYEELYLDVLVNVEIKDKADFSEVLDFLEGVNCI